MSHDTPTTRVFELDVLRFAAAAGVMLYHLTYRVDDGVHLFGQIDHLTRFGYLGVMLFFMISGFVILWTAVGRTPGEFVISRFARLYPIFWVCIILTVAGMAWMTGAGYDGARILANMTMVAGYLGFDYIEGAYWTLQVELKFYFLVFLLILFRQLGNVDAWLGFWLACCIAAWFVPYIGSAAIHPYGPYFIAGSTLYLVWRDGLDAQRSVYLAVCLLLCLVETWSRARGYIYDEHPGYAVAACCIVFVLFCVMMAVSLRRLRIGESRFLFRLAMMTYPLYLVHNNLGKALFDSMDTHRYTALAATTAAVVAVSYVLAVYIDRPLHRVTNQALRTLYRSITRRQG